MTRAANLAEAAGSGFAFRNKAINGAFDIWQRGTTFTTNSAYSADRFYSYGGPATTVSQQSFGITDTLGNDPAPNYYYRYSAVPFSGGTDVGIIGQKVEDWRQFLGKKVTVSFWYRKPSGVIVADSMLLHIKRSSGFYDNALEIGNSAPPATSGSSWAYYSTTFTVPANAASGQTMTSTASMEILWYYQQCPASGNIDIANFQIEIGSTPTAFERRPIATELALCQRYCVNYNSANANGTYTRYCYGETTVATSFTGNIYLPVPMRITPSLTTTATAINYTIYSKSTSYGCNTVPALGTDGSTNQVIDVTATTGSGLTSGYCGALMSNNNNVSYLLFTAEL